MSSGYTRAFASTAPVAPAVALPQGPMGTDLDCTAMFFCTYLYGLLCKTGPKRCAKISCSSWRIEATVRACARRTPANVEHWVSKF